MTDMRNPMFHRHCNMSIANMRKGGILTVTYADGSSRSYDSDGNIVSEVKRKQQRVIRRRNRK